MAIKKLSELSAGEKGKISTILGYKNEYECMGLYPGMKIEVLTHDSARGPCVIKTESGRMEIILKKELAVNVHVKTD